MLAGAPIRHTSPMSSAITQGIRVTVASEYMEERSTPTASEYAFSYTVRIANEGTSVAQLRSRHWYITDGNGRVEEVEGEGVVGAQPRLLPGQAFEYTSWCMLRTAHGSMHGTYRMVRESGEAFEATIAPFTLALPFSLN